MKIKQIITEDKIDPNKLFSEPFFKYNDYKNALEHSTNSTDLALDNNSMEAKVFPLIPRVKSTDTYAPIHNSVNYKAKKELGMAIRNETLFTYPVIDIIDNYSKVDINHNYIIVPKGEYTLFYNSDVHDFTIKYDTDTDNIIDGILGQVETDMEDYLDDVYEDVRERYEESEVLENFDSMHELLNEVSAEMHNELLKFERALRDSKSFYRDNVKISDLAEMGHDFLDDYFIPKNTLDINGQSIEISGTVLKEIKIVMYETFLNAVDTLEEDVSEYISGIVTSQTIPGTTSNNQNPEVMLECDEFYALTPLYFYYLVHEHLEGKE